MGFHICKDAADEDAHAILNRNRFRIITETDIKALQAGKTICTTIDEEYAIFIFMDGKIKFNG